MRPIVRGIALLLIAAAAGLLVSEAAATPNPNGAIIKTRIFNDNPGSTVTTSNLYPGSIMIDDVGGFSGGFANLHNWHFAVGGVEASNGLRVPSGCSVTYETSSMVLPVRARKT